MNTFAQNPPLRPRVTPGYAAVLAALLLGLGAAIAWMPVLALLLCGLALVLLASRYTEALSVLVFWALPYLIFSMTSPVFTLKFPEVVAYLFVAAVVVRIALRRERIALPPATGPVLLLLAVMAVSAAAGPPVLVPYQGNFGPHDRNNAQFRAASVVVWMGVSWLVVMALYHVVGSRPELYKRCVRAHILAAGLACLVSFVVYLLALRGIQFRIGGQSRDIVYNMGSYFRLSGVSYEPALFAFYLLTTIPVTIAVRIMRSGWMSPWLCTLSLTLQIICLLLTFSSSGWCSVLAALVALALFLRPSPEQWRKVAYFSGAFCIFIALAVGLALMNPLVSKALTFPIQKITGGGYAERNDEITSGWNMYHAYPVLGVGTGMAPFFMARFHPVIRNTSMVDVHTVNNLYVNTLAEDGVIGFAALALCGAVGLAGLLLTIKKAGSANVPILGALTASLLGTIVHYWSNQILFLIYFAGLLGLATAGARVADSGVEKT